MMRGHNRTRYSTPKKGTRQRQIILLMLRPQGVTADELRERGLVSSRMSMGGFLHLFRDLGGWDVRAFPVDNPHHLKLPSNGRRDAPKGSHKAKVLAYRIVGRDRWDGRYRSFLQGLTHPSR